MSLELALLVLAGGVIFFLGVLFVYAVVSPFGPGQALGTLAVTPRQVLCLLPFHSYPTAWARASIRRPRLCFDHLL